jgi:hypothetical protein
MAQDEMLMRQKSVQHIKKECAEEDAECNYLDTRNRPQQVAVFNTRYDKGKRGGCQHYSCFTSKHRV